MTAMQCLQLAFVCLIGAGAGLFLIGNALVRYSSADAPEWEVRR